MKLAILMAGTAALAAPAITSAQRLPHNRQSQYLYGYFGQSVSWLGSEEIRLGGGLGYALGKPEPRFQWGRISSQLVYDAYIGNTSGRSGYSVGNETTTAMGVLAYGRWFWPRDEKGRGMYADLGWGLQYANHTSRDLNLTFNSTPTLGVGGVFPTGNREVLLGLRYLHVSNGGLKKPNQGQNQFYLMLGLRF